METLIRKNLTEERHLKKQKLHFFSYYRVITVLYDTQMVWTKNLLFIHSKTETKQNKKAYKSETRPRPLKSSGDCESEVSGEETTQKPKHESGNNSQLQ